MYILGIKQSKRGIRSNIPGGKRTTCNKTEKTKRGTQI